MTGYKKNLIVDRRWLGDTGIGRYSRELLPRISALSEGYLDDGNPVLISEMARSYIQSRDFQRFYSPGYIPLPGAKSQVITIHDLILLRPNTGSVSKRLFFNKTVLPRIRDGHIKVVTVSRASQKEIAQWANIEDHEIPIVSNGISKEILLAGKNVNFERAPKSLVFVGNMKSHKNFGLFIDAVNSLPGSWSINLVGPGLNSTQIDDRHRVASYWEITDTALAEIYLKSSILVNTSSFEGFGMSFLEAGYLGCRVVHLGVLPTVKEILGTETFHTQGSYLASDLADLIVEVSKKSLKYQIRQHLGELYSWDISGKRLESILANP